MNFVEILKGRIEARRRAAGRVDARGARRAVSRAGEAGMTLLEVMIVLAIIGIIAGTVGVGLFKKYQDGLKKTAKTQVLNVQQAVEMYQMDHSQNCPQGIQDLVVDGKLDKRQLRDPYGKEIIVKCPGQANTDGVDVISVGPDKQEGTADDIKSWE
jgi:general secretion pathway protein G